MATDTLYDDDFLLWTERQAEALRRAAGAGSNLPLDFEHLAEEIEDLGKRDRREVESLVANILSHLIKLAFSPASDPRLGWLEEIDQYRQQLERTLRDSPSLRAKLSEIVEDELVTAVKLSRRAMAKHGESLPPTDEVRARLGPSLAERLTDEAWFPAPVAGTP